MKIKKHGKMFSKEKDPKIEKFICDHCGCEFTVKEDEYYVDFCGADQWTSGGLTYTISTIVKDYYVCSCPECFRICKKIHERPVNYTWSTDTTTTIGTKINPDGTDGNDYMNKDIHITCDSKEPSFTL